MRPVVVYVGNCPRCNAANSRKVIYVESMSADYNEMHEVCDKCKLDKVIAIINRRSYPYYWRLSILRNMLDRRPDDEGVQRSYDHLSATIKRIEIGITP